MLEEAIEVMRELWEGGQVSHDGSHYRRERAHLHAAGRPPAVIVSGFGPKAIELAARVGDGYVRPRPSGRDRQLPRRRRWRQGRSRPGRRCATGPTRTRRKTVHRLWPNEGLPGELAQVLPTPAHFEQASELVTEDMIAESVPCGPDLERARRRLQAYADAGVDELYVQQIGDRQAEFFAVLESEILPQIG